jgi:hypothetical protein
VVTAIRSDGETVVFCGIADRDRARQIYRYVTGKKYPLDDGLGKDPQHPAELSW